MNAPAGIPPVGAPANGDPSIWQGSSFPARKDTLAELTAAGASPPTSPPSTVSASVPVLAISFEARAAAEACAADCQEDGQLASPVPFKLPLDKFDRVRHVLLTPKFDPEFAVLFATSEAFDEFAVPFEAALPTASASIVPDSTEPIAPSSRSADPAGTPSFARATIVELTKSVPSSIVVEVSSDGSERIMSAAVARCCRPTCSRQDRMLVWYGVLRRI